MIYVDPILVLPSEMRSEWRWNESCHMFTDPGNEDELHAFAARLGLRREWFQQRGWFPHYYLTKTERKEAVRIGAEPLTMTELMEKMREWRKDA